MHSSNSAAAHAVPGQAKPGDSDPWVLVYAQLSNIAYCDAASIPGAVANISSNAPAALSMLWGPVQNGAGVLMFAVGTNNNGTTGTVLVVIRGTHLAVEWEELLLQMFYDFAIAPISTTFLNQPNGNITAGTYAGTQALLNMTDKNRSNQSIFDVIKSIVLDQNGNWNGVPIGVTGHSLGGCLAATVSFAVLSVLPNSPSGAVYPVSFGAPTPGDPTFATNFSSYFPYSRRYYSALDPVPLAYASWASILTIYSSINSWYTMTQWPTLWLYNRMTPWVNQYQFAQAGATSNLVPSTFDSTYWFYETEAGLQHSMATYITNLGGTPVVCSPGTSEDAAQVTFQRPEEQLAATPPVPSDPNAPLPPLVLEARFG